MKPIIISADEIKKELPNYDPAQSGDFHRESARMADKEYEKELKKNEDEIIRKISGS